MKLIVDTAEAAMDTTLVYCEEDLAFTTIPWPSGCSFSISVNEIELLVDETRTIRGVAGYSPHHGWSGADLSPPASIGGAIRIDLETHLVPGTTVAAERSGTRWPVYVNAENGWVCLRSPGSKHDAAEAHSVRFARDCIAVVAVQELAALWLHPATLPKRITRRR